MPIAYLITDSIIGSSDTAFFEAFERMEGALKSEGMLFENPSSTESDVQIVQTWPVKNVNATVRIYDNYITNIRHIEIATEREADLIALVDAAEANLPLESHASLVARWRSKNARPRVIVGLAISAPEPITAEIVEMVSKALDDPSPDVRSMAAFACGMLGDPRFEGPLLDRSIVEDDLDVRDYIDRALSIFLPN